MSASTERTMSRSSEHVPDDDVSDVLRSAVGAEDERIASMGSSRAERSGVEGSRRYAASQRKSSSSC